VKDRISEVTLHQSVDGSVECRREEQCLVGARRDAPQYPLDLGHEAHVGHAVGFVENEDVEVLNVHLATVSEINETTGCGDDDVATFSQ